MYYLYPNARWGIFMHKAKSLEFINFNSAENPLNKVSCSNQINYLKGYLSDLGARVLLIEPSYFDRDYLSEFSVFYSLSSRGYLNICKRVHYFKSENICRDLFIRAAGGDNEAVTSLQESYLGFSVIRPIPSSPLGRTVLKWYPERNLNIPRITAPSRLYTCHITGFTLTVTGLAWQQQDTGVAACATIGIWTMLHSSSLDAHHAIPTTAEITMSAHKSASLGSRIFPSNGLTLHQLLEAIKEQNLAPVMISGDIQKNNDSTLFFSIERFTSMYASFIRSGYPVLIIGHYENSTAENQSGHAICGVGFRESLLNDVPYEKVVLQDSHFTFFYVHDDNIGPNVRMEIVTSKISSINDPITMLKCSPRHCVSEKKLNNHFIPTTIVIAVHQDLRISVDKLYINGIYIAQNICRFLNIVYKRDNIDLTGVLYSVRFFKLHEYLSDELSNVLGKNKTLLAKARMELQEKVPPMSLHIGVVKIALPNYSYLLDVLYDTTDTDQNMPVFSHVIYDEKISDILSIINTKYREEYLGQAVNAF